MKKNRARKPEIDRMRSEYDFTGKKGERGKYYEAYKRGHQVKVHKANGSTVVQYFSLKDGAVMLEPDVQRYFPDSESVNKALRTLITLIPNKVSKPKNAKTR